MSALGTLCCALACAAVCAACTRVTDDMSRQPRTDPGARSPLFADQMAARPPAPDTVVRSRGDLAMVSSGRLGQLPANAPDGEVALGRGRDRYVVYCLPCHGSQGAGDGVVVRRGFPAPPPLTGTHAAALSDERLVAVIRQGSGIMAPFADRVDREDAQAIVVYLRSLQHAVPASAGSAR